MLIFQYFHGDKTQFVCILQFIARRLLELNERGTWVDPTGKKPSDLVQQEEEIFQIARLCNCAWFAQIVFSDYFSNILGLVRDGSTWSLTPFQASWICF